MRSINPLQRLIFPLVMALAACTSAASDDGAEPEDVSSVDAPLTNGADRIAYDFFVAKGLTSIQASGIVGNLDQESEMNPSAVQPGGAGRGIAQWSTGGRWDSDGKDNAEWYAGTRGESVWSLNLQLEFIWYELQTFSGFGLAALRQATSIAAATIAFEEHFEQCGGCEQSNRIAYAQATYNAFGHTPPPLPPPPGKPTPLPAGITGCGRIPAGHGLAPGKSVRSCDNRFELVMQGDGNLVEYGPVGVMWSSKTSGTDGYVADMQSDGNFVLYGKTSDAKWNSRTGGHPGSVLDLQNDGNVVVRDGAKALWSTGTTFPNAPAGPTTCAALLPGHGLAAGKSLKSCDGRFSLVMQADGNLVLHEGGAVLWNSKTSGLHGYAADMQSDGNFVVYDWKGKALWSSGSAGHPGAKLDLQSDGNAVIYAGTRAVWSSGTSGH